MRQSEGLQYFIDEEVRKATNKKNKYRNVSQGAKEKARRVKQKLSHNTMIEEGN